MYQHHEDSLRIAIDYFHTKSRVKDGLIAIIFGGSVAKGCERPDSDLDFMVIVTDDMYAQLKVDGIATEAIHGVCTYPEGYLDVKYYPKSFLLAVADHGSEPARNAWLKSKCLYTADPEIPALVEAIPRFQEGLREDTMLSFYGYLGLSSNYFWKMGKNDHFLRTRAGTDLVLYGLRMILEENGIFFPCAKGLYAAVKAAPRKPEGILEKADRMLETLADEAKDDFVNTVLGFLTWQPPEWDIATSRYTEDNELWWYNPRPLVAEW